MSTLGSSVTGSVLSNQQLVSRSSYSALDCTSLYAAEWWEPADKPGSVEGCHSSRARVATCLKRPTRKRARTALRSRLLETAASLFGLAPGGVCHAATCYHWRGALLPHRFTLTVAVAGFGGLLSVALSVGSRPPGVTWHLVRRSPDFPPDASSTSSGSLAGSRTHHRPCAALPQRSRCKATE